MGISPKAAEGPGAAWRISDINHDFAYSPTYPSVLCVPRTVSDNMLKYGGTFRKKSRIPALAYLHSNGGSITRCSQPMVGVQGKRNPQDERLVSAIFSSHTPPLNSPNGSPSQGPTRAIGETDGSGAADESLDTDISQAKLETASVMRATRPRTVDVTPPKSTRSSSVGGTKRSAVVVDEGGSPRKVVSDGFPMAV